MRDVAQVFRQAWAIYKRHFALMLGAVMSVTLLSFGVAILISRWIPPIPDLEAIGPTTIGLAIVQSIWGLYWQLGLSKLSLNVCRDESPRVSHLLTGIPPILAAVVVMFVVWKIYAASGAVVIIAVSEAAWALRIPEDVSGVVGLVAYYVLSMPLLIAVQLGVGFVITDRSQWALAGEPLRFTLRMVIRNFGGIYVLTLFCIVGALGSTVLCVLSAPFVASYLFLVFTVAYLKASGQSTSIVVPSRPGRSPEPTVVFPADTE